MRLPLARLLAPSPLKSVADLMRCTVDCAAQVPELIDKLIAGDQPAVHVLARDISRLEGLADAAKNAVRQHLPRRLFLPVDRRDLLRLVGEMDDVADCAEDVGVLLTLRPMQVPADMAPRLQRFVQQIMDTVHTAAALVELLEPLMAAGFGRKVARQAHSLIDQLQRQEHEADKLQDQLAKLLFQLEAEMPPVALFMWTKILSTLGEMANHAENIGDQFRLLLAD